MTRSGSSGGRSFFLTRAVARLSGIDLAQAMQSNGRGAIEYADMVSRCRACPNPEACLAWLSEARTPDNAIPPGCPNTKAFEALRKKV